ncbi:insulinase family protein [Colwellia sp. PAMC 21821]|uniref:insulinase family protein n=1 Tax=Colwellia sp. PAMC 21821 TaxID=1816219 RepID=UPI0009BFF8E6|nr:insulinase family protein [Colwellia sp. PAMC 21821]ARD43052.1 hypothetical protein A3Q33_01110 [Colwellia sp. PAMC 21821]
MSLAAPLIDKVYRHENGLKHVNIVNSEGFSALFVVNTPIFDNSGVAHGVEHSVFRRSFAFPQPETLFQLTALTDAKINASTFAQSTYFHCQSQCLDTFDLSIQYLLNGLFSPVFDKDDLGCEVYDGHEKGVIYRELIGIEQADKESEIQSATEVDVKTDVKSAVKNRAKSTVESAVISASSETKEEFNYGGVSSTIGNLTLNDLTAFHQRFYQASNMTLVTANADVEKISALISLLPVPTTKKPTNKKQTNQKLTNQGQKQQASTKQEPPKQEPPKQEPALKVENKPERKPEINEAANNDETVQHQAKYSPAINALINAYHVSLQASKHQNITSYTEVNCSSNANNASNANILKNNTAALADTLKCGLIAPLALLSKKFVKTANNARTADINSEAIATTAKQTLLPKLFSKLCEQAKAQLTSEQLSKAELSDHARVSKERVSKQQSVQAARVCDQNNVLWLTKIIATEQVIANITSYIVSAYPAFLARRCQGFCYATQALIIENSAYFAIYSAFDVDPDARLKEIPKCLLSLSQDKHFINASLALAKTKYCRVQQINCSKVEHLTAEDISNYLKALTDYSDSE